MQADSANLDDLDRLFDAVRREKGAIDVLWASAGTGEERKLGEITEQDFDAAFGLNARGTLFTVQKALPLFTDGGSILMTGSIASVKGYPFWSLYAASKAVLHAYARVWLSELRDRRIRVNVLTPGQVATPMEEQLFDEETKAQFEALIPRGKMGSPEEIATVALFLASDDSSYVNGMELISTAAPRQSDYAPRLSGGASANITGTGEHAFDQAGTSQLLDSGPSMGSRQGWAT